MERSEKRHGIVSLPQPDRSGTVTLEATLAERRSIRRFGSGALSLEAVAQLLWAGQGVTDRRGFRTAPSAGALYPLDLFLVAGEVDGLEPGVYRYSPQDHTLELNAAGDKRAALCRAALGQAPIREAPATVVVAAVPSRTTGKYGERGVRYVLMEAGHAAQNICLEAVALGLGSVVLGAFSDREVAEMVDIEESGIPLSIIPVGRAR